MVGLSPKLLIQHASSALYRNLKFRHRPRIQTPPLPGPQLNTNLFRKFSTFLERGHGSALLNGAQRLLFRPHVVLGVFSERFELHIGVGHCGPLLR
jgi:hypothetical protein